MWGELGIGKVKWEERGNKEENGTGGGVGEKFRGPGCYESNCFNLAKDSYLVGVPIKSTDSLALSQSNWIRISGKDLGICILINT